MDLEPNALLASLIVSAIGFVVFMYGKRAQRVPQIVVGILLCAFPYVVGDVVWISVIAGVLLAGLWLAIRFGL
jgi:hypothetical protein